MIKRFNSLFAVALLLPLSLFAEESNYALNQSATLGDIISKGGPLMYVLLFLSFLAFCLIFYYLFSLRTEVVAPKNLIKQLEEKKKDIEILSQICSENESPLAKIVAAGLETAKKTDAGYDSIKDSVEDEGARQAGALWNRIQYLQDIAIISPMVGLLGTVLGMIKSFGALYSENITPKPTIIAQGIAMALITTAAGLVIGIFSMIVYSYFRGIVNKLVAELESISGKLCREIIANALQKK